jgi:hypothetical protein
MASKYSVLFEPLPSRKSHGSSCQKERCRWSMVGKALLTSPGGPSAPSKRKGKMAYPERRPGECPVTVVIDLRPFEARTEHFDLRVVERHFGAVGVSPAGGLGASTDKLKARCRKGPRGKALWLVSKTNNNQNRKETEMNWTDSKPRLSGGVGQSGQDRPVQRDQTRPRQEQRILSGRDLAFEDSAHRLRV